MNNLERKMVDVLQDLKEKHNVAGIKAEFEAEGTRLEEALRLKEVVTRAGLELTIKVGGCEALKDMYDARSIGACRIVAPMIESPYALKKYLGAAKIVFPKEEIQQISLLANIETIMGVQNFDEMLKIDSIKELDGIVLGRVDMTGSLGMTREEINSERVFNIARDLFVKAKAAGLECVIGGGVAKESLPFFKNLPKGLLDRYETRKVIFKCPEALSDDAPDGILKAVGFELMWLKNKRNFYGAIYAEDEHRINMLEKRYKRLIEEAGVKGL
ncbi:MAG: citrate lyase beta subunit [Elusimicrobia bacterium GWA2_62_23]|nr:MAG: citrate lyase beta subunit [Elusimicrobia bacterium GWA2_62_23]OGR68752.1 MAG: citrate lyase beta subunit [Elusimicrobia bacterium GWC2_63_65]